MSKDAETKLFTILGALFILITPIWLYVTPKLIVPLFCNYNAQIYNPAVYGSIELYPCAGPAVSLTFWSIALSPCIGALFIYLAGNTKRGKTKKK